MRRPPARASFARLALALLLSACTRPSATPADAAALGPPAKDPAITGVSPRTTSNETAQPLLVYGRALKAASKLHLGSPFNRDLPLDVVDSGFATARLPADLAMPPNVAEVAVPLTPADEDGMLLGEGVSIVVVNDTGFADLQFLAATADLRFAFVPSPTTDELLVLDTASGAVSGIAVGDGPTAAVATSLGSQEVVVVAHRHSRELRVITARPDAKGARTQRTLPAPDLVEALAVREGVAYLGERRTGSLAAVDLADGKELWRAPALPGPRGIATSDRAVALGSIATGEIALFDRKSGAALGTAAPRPGVSILGGHTEKFGDRVMGGRGIRALAATSSGGVFVASAGPNVGPNKEKMSTSPCGGVGFVDGATRSYARHLAFDFGVAQALALDETRGRLYVADVGEGLIHVVDAKALATDDAKARKARLATIPLAPLSAMDPVRTPDDFGEAKPGGPKHARRAGLEVHTGPQALALSGDGKALLVLERFTGRVTRLDVRGEAPKIEKSFQVAEPLTQADRRRGQVLYFADLGRTGMSCDVCHPEGRGDGVFFTKTDMERIWRSPPVRGSRDTPPYFNPPAHPTLEDTVSYVGSNNRFQNPQMSPEEVRLLASYSRALTTPPNPWRNERGGLAATVPLDEGRRGAPEHGRQIFAMRCASCHPAPLFSTDQDVATRGKFLKVDTLAVLPLRADQQDLSFSSRTPPSLVGAWDVWPMLLSGAAGFGVSKSGEFLEVRDRSAVRAVLERYSPKGHGDAAGLDPAARADLEAFVTSL